jgi:hypothetical protein
VKTLTGIDNPAVSMAAKVANANIILVVFNMIPDFPMDGGPGVARAAGDAHGKCARDRSRGIEAGFADAGARGHADRRPDRVGARQARYGASFADTEKSAGGGVTDMDGKLIGLLMVENLGDDAPFGAA